MKIYQLLLPAICFMLLSSCVNKFTAAQRDSLSTVAISPTLVKSGAYAEPYGGDRKAANNAAMTGTMSGTGALGGIVGSLVGETIAATQNNLFRGKGKSHFDAVQKNTPDVGGILNANLINELKKEPFFCNRIRKDSLNSITSEINSYRLVRSGKDQSGELLLAPEIIVKLGLKNAAGESLMSGTYVGTGYSNPLSVYATNPAKSKEGYELASKMAIEAFTTVIGKKTAL